jgi:hypothetical protein
MVLFAGCDKKIKKRRVSANQRKGRIAQQQLEKI